MSNYNTSTEEEITCEAIYLEWTEDHLETLAFEKDLRHEFDSKYLRRHGCTAKEALVKVLADETRKQGQKHFIAEITKELLVKICEPLGEEYLTSNGANSITKTVLSKRLNEKMGESPGGFFGYLVAASFPAEIYVDLLKILGEEPVGTKRKRLCPQLEEALEVYYLRSMLTTVPASFLKEICSGIKIYTGNCTSVQIIADCMIFGKHYVPDKVFFPYSVPSVTEKPKRIHDKLTKGDLEYWFTAEDLKKYLAKHEQKSSGKKNELSARIVAYWNRDEEAENVPVEQPKSTKRRTKKASRPLAERTNIVEEVVPKKSKKNKSRLPEPEPVNIVVDPMSFSEESSDFDM